MDGEKGHLGGRCLTYGSDFLHQAGFLSLVFIGKIAGEGNRTPVCSLGSCHSTIELHPRRDSQFSIADLRFASREQSLPRNHVVVIDSRFLIAARCCCCSILIRSKGPRNYSYLERTGSSISSVGISDRVVVVSINPNVVPGSPRVIPLAVRRFDSGPGISLILCIGRGNKDNLPSIKRTAGEGAKFVE